MLNAAYGGNGGKGSGFNIDGFDGTDGANQGGFGGNGGLATGGGVYIHLDNASPPPISITNSTFRQNYALGGRGGAAGDGYTPATQFGYGQDGGWGGNGGNGGAGQGAP